MQFNKLGFNFTIFPVVLWSPSEGTGEPVGGHSPRPSGGRSSSGYPPGISGLHQTTGSLRSQGDLSNKPRSKGSLNPWFWYLCLHPEIKRLQTVIITSFNMSTYCWQCLPLQRILTFFIIAFTTSCRLNMHAL